MGNIFTGYQIYGTSNNDLHSGLGYINYDRDANVDVNELYIIINRITGPRPGGAYRVDGSDLWSFTITIACEAESKWASTRFTYTGNGSTGVSTFTTTVLDGQLHIQENASSGSFTTNNKTYNYATISSTLRSFSNFSKDNTISGMGACMGFHVPWYDGLNTTGLSGKVPVEQEKYIINNNLKPSNEAELLGDYGITTWTVYCFNIDFPMYRVVWKNDYVESNKLADVATIRMSVGDLTEGLGPGPHIKWRDNTYEYNYNNGYFVFTYYQLSEDIVQYEGRYPIVKLQLLNAEGISIYDRYVQFATIPATYYGLSSTNNGDVLIFRPNEDGESDRGYLDRKDSTADIDPIVDFGNSSNLLISSYVISDEKLQALGQDIWDTSGLDNIFKINSYPLDNLLSVYRTPFAISGDNSNSHIMIGNFETNINAPLVNDSQIRKICDLQLVKYYDNFLDLEPFTKILIYLPLIGLVSIEPSKIREKASIYYSFDVRLGSCSVTLRSNNNVLDSWICQIGDSLELSSTNTSQVKNNIGLSLMSDCINNGMNGTIDYSSIVNLPATLNNSFATVRKSGNFNTSAEMRNGLTLYIIYIRPWYQEALNYAHTYGKPCNLTKTISTLKGYTKCSSNVDLSGIPCTESQRQMIFEKLTGGFYI